VPYYNKCFADAMNSLSTHKSLLDDNETVITCSLWTITVISANDEILWM